MQSAPYLPYHLILSAKSPFLALSASSKAGWIFAFLIGILFMLGMILADGLNGLLVAQAIFRGDKISITLSRVIGSAIAVFSLAIGILGLVELW